MRYIKWFLYTLLLVVLVTSGGLYYLWSNFDLNNYKPLVEKIVYQQTGRTLNIKGSADIELSLIPTLVVKDVRFSNPKSWQTTENMIEVGSMEIKIALLPLLEKKILIDKIILHQANIKLQTSSKGENNWDFSTVQPLKKTSYNWLIKEAYAGEIEVDKTLITDVLSEIRAQKILIRNSQVSYYEADKKLVDVVLKDVSLSMEGMDKPINASWNIVFDDVNIQGKGNFGSLNGIFAEDKAWPISAEIEALNINAHLKGNLFNLINKKIKADIFAKVENPEGNLNAPKIILETDIKADIKKADMSIKRLNVANNIIEGNIKIDISQKLPFVKVSLASDLINIKYLIPPYKTTYKVPSLIRSAQAGDIVPSIKIPYQYLNLLNAKIKLSVRNLILNPDMSFSDVNLNADLKNGILNLNPLQIKSGKGVLTTTAQLDAKQQKITLKIKSNDIVLQELHQEFAVKDKSDFGIINGGESEIFVDLKGYGKSTKSIAESLNGQVILIVKKSELQSGKLKFLTNDFSRQLLNILQIDINKPQSLLLNCAVVRADIENGKINIPSGVAFDSDKINLVAGGRVDLKTDKIKLNVNVYHNNIADISIVQALTNLIKISGKIQNPKISIDRGGALKTIASVAAGPAYAGAGMFLDKDKNPCYTALKGTIYQDYLPKPSGIRNAAHKGYKGTEEFVSGGVRQAKKSAKELKQNVKSIFNNFLK